MDSTSTVTLYTGNTMPVLGLGSWQLTDDTPGTIATALQLGYRMIDTSGDYGTQPGISEGIRQSGVSRNDIYLTTKVEEYDDAYEATRANLAELDMDYVNLMLIHRPPSDGVGEELWQGLMRAKQEGLTKDIGVSNYPRDKLQVLIDQSNEVPVVNQIEWSPFGYTPEMLEFCDQNNIVIQAYSPLSRGTRLDDQRLQDIAARHQKSPAQILIRWDLQTGVVPIIKANNPEHQRENIDVFDFELNDDDMQALDRLNEQYSALTSRMRVM